MYVNLYKEKLVVALYSHTQNTSDTTCVDFPTPSNSDTNCLELVQIPQVVGSVL